MWQSSVQVLATNFSTSRGWVAAAFPAASAAAEVFFIEATVTGADCAALSIAI